MHVVATNVIIWFRTLIKESLDEIEEYEVEEGAHSANGTCDFLLLRMQTIERRKTFCEKFTSDLLSDDVLSTSSPYLYPFIIEFALIGASVLLIMSNHIGKM